MLVKYHKDLKEEEGSPSSLPTNYRHTLGVMIPGLQPQGMKRRARNEARNSMSRERSEENGQKCMCPQLKYWKTFLKNTRIVTKERGVCGCVCVLLLLKNKLYFCLFISEGTGACMPQCKYGGLRSPASSSPLVPGLEFRLSGVAASICSSTEPSRQPCFACF